MIYFVMFIFFAFLAIRNDFLWQRGGIKALSNLALIMLICVSGFRYKVGGDTIGYMEYFDDIPYLWEVENFNFSLSSFDPLWILFSSLCKSIVDDYFFLQFVHSVVINVIIFRFFKASTPYFSTAILIYFLFFYLYFTMEIMRESLAISMFLLAFPYYLKKRWLKYYLFASLAFLFHSSAIIVFIFPLFSKVKLTNLSIILLVPLILVLQYVVVYQPALLNIILFTDRLSTKFEGYSQMSASINGMIYYSFIYVFLPYLLVSYYRRFSANSELFKNFHFLYFLLAAFFVAITGFGRVLNYLTPFMIVYFATFLNDFVKHAHFDRKVRPLFAILICFVAFYPKIVYYLTNTSHLVQNTRKYNMYLPYTNMFTKEEYREREIMWRENFEYRRRERN